MTKQFVLFFLSFLSFFISEHTLLLPLIVFIYYLGSLPVKKALKKTLPLFCALGVYILFFLSNATYANFLGSKSFMERIIYITPQVFLHTIKLILVPIHLNIDQTSLIYFDSTANQGYAVFCLIYLLAVIATVVISFLNKKTVFILLAPFLISLIPFLQILTPTYCLMSERYMYMPLFFLVFGIGRLMKENK